MGEPRAWGEGERCSLRSVSGAPMGVVDWAYDPRVGGAAQLIAPPGVGFGAGFGGTSSSSSLGEGTFT